MNSASVAEVSADVNTRRSATCQQKLALLGDTATERILLDVRNEIIDDYIYERPHFLMSFFPECFKSSKTISLAHFVKQMKQALLEDSSEAEETKTFSYFVVSSYIYQHLNIYNFYEAELMKLGTTDLEAAQVISPEQSQTLVDDSVAKFGRELTHSFVVILSVLLDDGVFALLCKQVQHQKAEISDSQSITLKQKSYEKKLVDAKDSNAKKPKMRDELLMFKKNSQNAKYTMSLPRIKPAKQPGERDFKTSLLSKQLFTKTEPNESSGPRDSEFTKIRRSTGSCIQLRSQVDYQQILRSKAGYALVCYHNLGESEVNKAWKKKWICFKGVNLQFSSGPNTPTQWCVPLHLIKEIWTGGRRSSFSILALETEFRFQVEETEARDWFFAFQTQIAAHMEDLIMTNIEEESDYPADMKWWRVKDKQLSSSLGLTLSPSMSQRKLAPPLTQTELYTWHANDRTFNAAVHSSQNARKYMEDRHLIIPSIYEKFSLSPSSTYAHNTTNNSNSSPSSATSNNNNSASANGNSSNNNGSLSISSSRDSESSTTSSNAINSYSFFGVFDGHGGVDASQFVKENLLANIFAQPSFFTDISDAILKGSALTDADFLDYAKEENIMNGSTACFGFLENEKLTIANVGDSRAVLSKCRVAVALSDDHKPNRFDEAERIFKAGGKIDCCHEMNVARLYELNPQLVNESEIPNRLAKMVGFNEVYRIQKELSVSRAFGDRDFKLPYCKDTWEDTECVADLVIATPELVTCDLTDGDEFLIIACDGLWDVFTNQAAVDYVHAKLKLYPDQGLKVTTLLAQEAIKLGSQDNITVMVLFIGPKKPRSPSPTRKCPDHPDSPCSHVSNGSPTNNTSPNGNCCNSTAHNGTAAPLHLNCDAHVPVSLSPQKNKLTLSGIRKKKSHSTGMSTSGMSTSGGRESFDGERPSSDRSPRGLSSSTSPSPRSHSATNNNTTSNTNNTSSSAHRDGCPSSPRRGSSSSKRDSGHKPLLSNSSPTKPSYTSSAGDRTALLSTVHETLPPRSSSLPSVSNTINSASHGQLRGGGSSSPSITIPSPKIVVIDESANLSSSPHSASQGSLSPRYTSLDQHAANANPSPRNASTTTNGSAATSSAASNSSPRASPPSTPTKSLRDSRKKKHKKDKEKTTEDNKERV